VPRGPPRGGGRGHRPEQWKVTGAAATEVIANAVQDIVTVHDGHDPQIVVETAVTARGRWSLYDRLEYGDEVMHGYGHYHESYRRVQGQVEDLEPQAHPAESRLERFLG